MNIKAGEKKLNNHPLVPEKNADGSFCSCACASYVSVTSVTLNRFLLLVQKIVLMRYCCQACDRQGYLQPQQAKWSLEPVGEQLGILQMFDLL